MPYYIELMTQEDVSEVSQVERRCFSNPWPSSAYRRELRDPARNYYVVLRWRDPRGRALPTEERPRGPRSLLPFGRRADPAVEKGPICGFAGMWILLDEAHITTIGVTPERRGQALGEFLLVRLAEQALERRARWLTLEVRVSNAPAQALYEKYGFTRQGVRKRYYSDNGEDAYIMWSPDLTDPAVVERYRALRAALESKLARWEDAPDSQTVSARADAAERRGSGN